MKYTPDELREFLNDKIADLTYSIDRYPPLDSWKKNRAILRQIRDSLQPLSDELVGALIGVGLNLSHSENPDRESQARKKIRKLLQGEK